MTRSVRDYDIAVRSPYVLAAALLVSACEPRRAAHELRAIQYVEVVREERCAHAFAMLTSEVQELLRREAAAAARENRVEADPPSRFYCHPPVYSRVELEKTRTVAAAGEVAEVHVVERVPTRFLVPGFWPTKHEDQPIPFILRKESGSWRVEPPRLREELAARARSRQLREDALEKARRYNERFFGRQ